MVGLCVALIGSGRAEGRLMLGADAVGPPDGVSAGGLYYADVNVSLVQSPALGLAFATAPVVVCSVSLGADVTQLYTVVLRDVQAHSFTARVLRVDRSASWGDNVVILNFAANGEAASAVDTALWDRAEEQEEHADLGEVDDASAEGAGVWRKLASSSAVWATGSLFAAPTSSQSSDPLTFVYEETDALPIVLTTVLYSAGDVDAYFAPVLQITNTFSETFVAGTAAWTDPITVNYMVIESPVSDPFVDGGRVKVTECATTACTTYTTDVELASPLNSAPGVLVTALNYDNLSTTLELLYVSTISHVQDTGFSPLVHLIGEDVPALLSALPETVSWVAWNLSQACAVTEEGGTCNGQGSCTAGVCSCFTGWTGTNCTECDDGYYGQNCDPCNGLVQTGQVCGNHGVCNGSATHEGNGNCTCDPGYIGLTCSDCTSGFYPTDEGNCSICPTSNGTACGSHGECATYVVVDDDMPIGPNSTETLIGVCECFGHWTGDACEECEEDWLGKNCNMTCVEGCVHGNCTLDSGTGDDDPETTTDDSDDGLKALPQAANNGSAGATTATCSCDSGWNGTSCDVCASDRYGTDCSGKCPDCEHGVCDSGETGTGECECDTGWNGNKCDACASGYYSAGNGTECEECPGGANDPCNGHGQNGNTCPDGKCNCESGWTGHSCGDRVVSLPWEYLVAGSVTVGGVLLSAAAWFSMRAYRRRRANERAKDDFRGKLLTRWPELAGMEENFEDMMSDATDWYIPFETLVVGELVGRGVSSNVFRGEYSSHEVAIKRLHSMRWDAESFELFFRQEAALLARLHHPNVVRFFGVSYAADHFHIITEFCAFNLLQLTKGYVRHTQETLNECAVLALAHGIAQGGAFLHSKNIVHRDLKPENVLFDTRGVVKLCDFGLARLTSNDAQMTQLVGTPAFMAPELASNTFAITDAVDVYAFGILAWTCWTCELPYRDFANASNAFALFQAVVQGHRPPIPAGCPESIASLMRSCWAGDPSQRPSFQQVADRIAGLLEELGLSGATERKREIVTCLRASIGKPVRPAELRAISTGAGQGGGGLFNARLSADSLGSGGGAVRPGSDESERETDSVLSLREHSDLFQSQQADPTSTVSATCYTSLTDSHPMERQGSTDNITVDGYRESKSAPPVESDSDSGMDYGRDNDDDDDDDDDAAINATGNPMHGTSGAGTTLAAASANGHIDRGGGDRAGGDDGAAGTTTTSTETEGADVLNALEQGTLL